MSSSRARLILVGQGLAIDQAGATWAKRRGYSERVEFRGPLTQGKMLQCLREEGDIFVHSTLEESFCMTVLEAMAQGLPVVVLPESGAVPWVVGEGAAGLIADSQSAESLCQSMLEITGNAELRAHLAMAGYNRASSMFDLDNVADRYLEEYQKVMLHYAANR